MEENNDLSIWQKNQSELTVGESLKIGLGVGIVMTVLPMVVFGAAAGVAKLGEICRERKAAKLELVNNEEKN